VIRQVDCTVLGGIRTPEQQADLVSLGLSQTLMSKHLPQADGLAHALDVAPYPQRWSDPGWKVNQVYFAGFVLGLASQLGTPLRWGGNWKRDHDPQHNGFDDLDHFELVLDP
jgi:peptidoglycan L-alanyl-D-glutamate endopeptidase CwlK